MRRAQGGSVRIFNRLRADLLAEGRVGRYLRYALGEIVLVAIGILMALQVSNWNQDRLERQRVRASVLALESDLAQDLRMLVPVEGQIRRLMRQADSLAGYVRDTPVSEIENAAVFVYTYSLAYRPYNWNRAALEQLKSSGGLEGIRSHELVEKISAYDALTHHLEQDYLDDVSMIRDAAQHINRVRNLNYPQFPQARAYFDGVADNAPEDGFFRFNTTETFRAMQRERLPLITTDPVQVHIMVNAMLDIREAITPRVEGELPRLRRLSADISALIEREYH